MKQFCRFVAALMFALAGLAGAAHAQRAAIEEPVTAVELDEIRSAFIQIYLKSLRQQRDYADAFDHTKPSVIRLARTLGQSQTPRMLVVPETAQTRM